MLRTNADRLIRQPVVGEPDHPRVGGQPYRVGPDGSLHIVPGLGGITYNVRVGDPCLGWAADHLEPAVSLKNSDNDRNGALNLYACVGNQAAVLDGDAKGAVGVVTGKHGGIEHVMIDFPEDVLRKLKYGEVIQVESWGLGLELPDAPQVRVQNLDPDLLQRLGLELTDGSLRVPVAHVVPAAMMGSGLGAQDTHRGDYDIQLFDAQMVQQHGLEGLRLGDLAAITDADHSYGRVYRTGAISVGIISHGACVGAGHGPGVTTLFTSAEGHIEPVVDAQANLADILGLRTTPTPA
ncbi:MAG: DUF4438 domain-containing protein [Armatimonadetes bacterium]|nr:DUF4438 domain-containing protein [Armatimonadota bacterium]